MKKFLLFLYQAFAKRKFFKSNFK